MLWPPTTTLATPDMPHTRDATPDDAAVVAAIYNESIAAGDSTMDTVPQTAEVVRRQIEGFAAREAILLLEDADQIVGWGIVKRYSDRPGYRFCCETSVYLRRALTGRGYGSRLQQALIERCREYGYHHLVAKIWADNTVSLRLHEKFGYEVVGTQREIGHVNGHWQDVTILQLLLGDVEP